MNQMKISERTTGMNKWISNYHLRESVFKKNILNVLVGQFLLHYVVVPRFSYSLILPCEAGGSPDHN